MQAFALTAVLALLASPLAAHPHVFVETGLRLIQDEAGRTTAIEVTWTYDELISLLILEDRELDEDFDGVLTPEEEVKLQGFDMDWPEGYEGDIYVTAAGAPLALGPPETGAAHLNGKGQLVGIHRRPFARPIDGRREALAIKVYDPSYYTAYEIMVDQVTAEVEGCDFQVFTPDIAAAQARLDAALEELLAEADFDVELEFPMVGDQFAEEARLVCQSGS